MTDIRTSPDITSLQIEIRKQRTLEDLFNFADNHISERHEHPFLNEEINRQRKILKHIELMRKSIPN